jgi:hypothetical protein
MQLNGVSNFIQVKMMRNFGHLDGTRQKISMTMTPTKIGKLNNIIKPVSEKRMMM